MKYIEVKNKELLETYEVCGRIIGCDVCIDEDGYIFTMPIEYMTLLLDVDDFNKWEAMLLEPEKYSSAKLFTYDEVIRYNSACGFYKQKVKHHITDDELQNIVSDKQKTIKIDDIQYRIHKSNYNAFMVSTGYHDILTDTAEWKEWNDRLSEEEIERFSRGGEHIILNPMERSIGVPVCSTAYRTFIHKHSRGTMRKAIEIAYAIDKEFYLNQRRL